MSAWSTGDHFITLKEEAAGEWSQCRKSSGKRWIWILRTSFLHTWIQSFLSQDPPGYFLSVQSNKFIFFFFLLKPICFGFLLCAMNGVPSDTEVCSHAFCGTEVLALEESLELICPHPEQTTFLNIHSILSTMWLAYSWGWKTRAGRGKPFHYCPPVFIGKVTSTPGLHLSSRVTDARGPFPSAIWISLRIRSLSQSNLFSPD